MSRRITRSSSLEPNDNNICPICMGSMDFFNLNQRGESEQQGVTELPCSHKFHDNCIRGWSENNNNTCPVCRKNMYLGVSSLDNNDTPEDIYNTMSNVLNMFRNGNENVFESRMIPPNMLYQKLIPFGLRERNENNGNEVMLVLRSVVSRDTPYRKAIIRIYNNYIYQYAGHGNIDGIIYLFASLLVDNFEQYIVLNQMIKRKYEDSHTDIGIENYDYGNKFFDLVREYYLFIGVDNLNEICRNEFTQIFTADPHLHTAWYFEAMTFIHMNPNEIINLGGVHYTYSNRYTFLGEFWKYFIFWLSAGNGRPHIRNMFLTTYGNARYRSSINNNGSWENELGGGKKKRKVKRKTKRKINKRRKTRRKI